MHFRDNPLPPKGGTFYSLKESFPPFTGQGVGEYDLVAFANFLQQKASMSEQPSNWPPPKHKSKAWLFGVGIALFVLVKVALVFWFVMFTQGLNRMSTLGREDEDLDQYDLIEGDYLEWAGEEMGSVYQMKRRLVFDESGRFATKFIFHDSSEAQHAPADVDFYGQWSETNEVLTLKFYYAPEKWTDLFDSLKNESHIRFVDNETVELNLRADTIWMSGVPCVKRKE